MHRKPTTAPDGIRGVKGPPTERPVKVEIPPERRISPGKVTQATVELARKRRRLRPSGDGARLAHERLDAL